jgi:hypothetical protein
MNLKELAKVIPDYKWRIDHVSKSYPSAACVAYIDARDVMYILDEVVGPENWQSDFKEIKDNLYAGIGIRINGEWLWKWDCGTESNIEKEKGESSDAFKRAAVKWGIGRFLYDLPVQYVKTNDKKGSANYPYPVDENGNRINNLTSYLNENVNFNQKVSAISFFPVKKDTAKTIADITESLEQEAINKVRKCKTRENLREIRQQYKDLEYKSSSYKKAIADRYEILM